MASRRGGYAGSPLGEPLKAPLGAGASSNGHGKVVGIPRVENSLEGIPLLLSNSPYDAIRPATATEIILADRVADLEAALQLAQSTVEFLHGCLSDDSYLYAYPLQTLRHLEEWAKLAPRPESCFHSVTTQGCSSCADRNRRFELAAQRAQRAEERKNV